MKANGGKCLVALSTKNELSLKIRDLPILNNGCENYF